MATNSRREQILLAFKVILEGLPSIKKVARKQPTSPEDLKLIAGTQMPFLSMIGGVPQPKPHVSGRKPGGADVVISELPVKLFVYFMDNVDGDSTLSDIMDDVWSTVWNDQTLGFRFVHGITIAPNADPVVWEPYVAFSMVATITYNHNTKGI